MIRDTRVFLAGVVVLSATSVGVAVGSMGGSDTEQARPVEERSYASAAPPEARPPDPEAEHRSWSWSAGSDDHVRSVAPTHAALEPCSLPDQLRRWWYRGGEALADCSAGTP